MSEGPARLRASSARPGSIPGQVVEVKNPAMIVRGAKNPQAIKATLDRGMKELTGADDAVEAWRNFFEPGDVVGIKVVPNGQPDAHSSFEIVLEVIEELKAAGVKTNDIFVYDRYRGEFMEAGYHKILPDGIRWGGLDRGGRTSSQLDFPVVPQRPDRRLRPRRVRLDGPGPLRRRPQGRPQVPLAPGQAGDQDGQQDRRHPGAQGPRLGGRDRGLEEHEPRLGQQRGPVAQQHLHQRLQPVHPPGGHATRSSARSSSCRSWTASAASTRAGRSRGRTASGPGRTTSLFFATDPVALDHVEWDIVDAKRVQDEPPAGRRVGQAGDRSARDARASTSASRSTSPWPAPWAWATSTSSRPAAGGSRSSTRRLRSESPSGTCAQVRTSRPGALS